MATGTPMLNYEYSPIPMTAESKVVNTVLPPPVDLTDEDIYSISKCSAC